MSEFSRITAPARRLAGQLGEALATRLELAALEVEAHRLHLARQAAATAWMLFFVGAGTLLTGTWVVLLCPPAYRVLLVGVLALAFLGAALATWLLIARRAAAEPPLMHDTLQELRKDLEAWRDTEDA